MCNIQRVLIYISATETFVTTHTTTLSVRLISYQLLPWSIIVSVVGTWKSYIPTTNSIKLWDYAIGSKVRIGTFFYVPGISNGCLFLRYFWCIDANIMNVQLWGHWLNKSLIGENWLSAQARAHVKFLHESQVSQLCPYYPLWAKVTNLKHGVGCTRRGVSRLP